MNHPHPWLAALARVDVWLAVSDLLVSVGLFVYRPDFPTSYWQYLAYRRRGMDSGWQIGLFLREDSAAVAHTLAPPLVWLTAGWLLRAAATGRLGLVAGGRRAGPARLLAQVGLVWATAAVGVAVYRWAAPTNGVANGPTVAQRVTKTADTGMLVNIDYDIDGRPAGFGERRLPSEYDPATNTYVDGRPWVRAAVATVCEARTLAGHLWPSASLVCLCGLILVVTRPLPGKEA